MWKVEKLNILADTMKGSVAKTEFTPCIPYHYLAVRKENIYYAKETFIWE